MNRIVWSFFLVIMLGACARQNPPPRVVGKWVGNLIINENVSLRVGCEVKLVADSLVATMASIDQGAYGIEISSIAVDTDTLMFTVNQMGVTYTGLFKSDTLIEGHFVQGGSPPMVLNFARAESIPGEPPPRHQTPSKPYPYIEENVEFISSITDMKLAGTLTYPKRGKNLPAVLLIPGSGPNDRDETIWGHKVFLVLADYLTRNGMVVLRLDDRGVGESTGDFGSASILDFADDAMEAVDYLKNRKDLPIAKIGLIGHSLGADIAPVAANGNPAVDFIVLMAGSGINFVETIHFQTEHIYSQRGAGREAIDLNRRINQTVFDIAATNKTRPEMEQALGQAFVKLSPELNNISGEDRQKAELPDSLRVKDYAGFFSEHMRIDLFHSPTNELEKLNVPVLLLAGEKDTQISAELNIPLMRAALHKGGNDDFDVSVFPDVNHLFQTCSTGEVEEYNQIGETIAPKVL